jgi:hypothetical protein
VRRYDGWGHTLRRLRWLVGRAPKTCPVCGELYFDLPHTVLYFEGSKDMVDPRCGYCGERGWYREPVA